MIFQHHQARRSRSRKCRESFGFLAAVILFLPLAIKAESFPINDPGTETIVDYSKYGVFDNLGTSKYQYKIRDRAGLSAAVGEGIYPNVSGILDNPHFKEMQAAGKLEGNIWDFVNTQDYQANFYKWASSREVGGIKQFYSALMLERAGHIAHAIKAYQAAIVHFPKTTGSTFWKTPWYIGPTALDKISFLTRSHPELGMKLVGGRIRIQNRFDDNVHNDVYEIDPGKIVAGNPADDSARTDISKLKVIRKLGGKRTRLQQLSNGHWQMLVDNKPFVIRGIAYSPTPVGLSPDLGTLDVHKDWMLADTNKNSLIDGPYESWVDANRNDQQDKDEPVVGDFKLLQDMGVNTIRLYHHGFNKKVLSDLYKTYGIRVVMGDYFGVYAIGSGADWNAGTDYTNPEQQEKMLASLREMVTEYKDEPYVIMWVLGNENNYSVANNSRKVPDAYYKFVNRAAKLIKSLDRTRPVALCNGDLLFLDKVVQFCPDVDIYGANAYRGDHGFGDSLWHDLADFWKKPAFISEFGCPAYHSTKGREEGERLQAEYLKNNWLDIEHNTAGAPGAGNALGGVIFEWLDEWWKAGPPPQYDAKIQDTVGQFGGPFPDGWSYEEWFGVASQGKGQNSPFMRQLRPAYKVFKELWNSQNPQDRGMSK